MDLAISTKESADYTADRGRGSDVANDKLELYIQPHPIIRHMNFNDTMEAPNNVQHSSVMSSQFLVEAPASKRLSWSLS